MTTLTETPMQQHPAARLRTAALALAAGVLGLATAAGAQGIIPTPPQERPVVLRGATIHTVTKGTIQNGSIVLDRGRITAIGTDVAVPPGARIVDVSGKHIYPGLIDAYSTVGISEIGSVEVSNDIAELGDFNPNVRAEVAVNAESRHIGTTRSAGVLVAFSTPEGGVISGLSSAMSLEGWTWEEMSLKGAAALNVNWPDPARRAGGGGRGGGPGGPGGQAGPAPKTYAEQVQEIKDFFGEARAYRDAVKAGQPFRTDSRLAAMIPAINGDIPVVVAAEGVQQINDAITWAKQEGVKLVIRGGRDAIHVAERLKAEQVPVILTSTMAAPSRNHEGYDGAYGAPAQLHKAGVKFAISGGSGALYSNRLPWEAGVAVAFGLPEEEALKAVTINAAEFLGVADKVGSLEVGKEATLLITTGTPLDMTNDVQQAWIQGREVDMRDIQRFFFEKYFEKIKQQQKKIVQ
jgi:imidazolonepropionase-like amidohydrolase